EYVLGVLAQQNQDLPQAIGHFRRATTFDPQFGDAFTELGRALLTSGDAAHAVQALETAVRLQPANPAPHYLLSSAYRRTGKIEDANRELAAYRRTQSDAERQLQDIRAGVLGRKSPAQEESQPR
ncbi:MAG: tetratricopeptide repeat protein, partial [Terriglobia bacterium]